ncbi:MAG: hypothetical protein U5K31_12510 [Balneolaceae bacterium]|nr:hypothetical protein [Balneolaceae bacterium]
MTKIGLKSLYSNSTTKSNKLIEGPYQNGVNRLTVWNSTAATSSPPPWRWIPTLSIFSPRA